MDRKSFLLGKIYQRCEQLKKLVPSDEDSNDFASDVVEGLDAIETEILLELDCYDEL